jgi:hypothetical protein
MWWSGRSGDRYGCHWFLHQMLEKSMAEEIEPDDDHRRGLAVEQLSREITSLLKGHHLSTIELSFAVVIEFLQEHVNFNVPQLVYNIQTQKEIMKDKEKGHVNVAVVSKKTETNN